MKMVVTAGVLTAALLLAVLSTVQAQEPNPLKPENVTPVVVVGE
ncbi:MAG: hypothetical protein ACM31O_19555 [Bacteroidota bacterium]|jgi:hypothetical protein